MLRHLQVVNHSLHVRCHHGDLVFMWIPLCLSTAVEDSMEVPELFQETPCVLHVHLTPLELPTNSRLLSDCCLMSGCAIAVQGMRNPQPGSKHDGAPA